LQKKELFAISLRRCTALWNVATLLQCCCKFTDVSKDHGTRCDLSC